MARACVVDWILAARNRFEEVEPLFDAWWASFVSTPPAEGEAR